MLNLVFDLASLLKLTLKLGNNVTELDTLKRSRLQTNINHSISTLCQPNQKSNIMSRMQNYLTG